MRPFRISFSLNVSSAINYVDIIVRHTLPSRGKWSQVAPDTYQTNLALQWKKKKVSLSWYLQSKSQRRLSLAKTESHAHMSTNYHWSRIRNTVTGLA